MTLRRVLAEVTAGRLSAGRARGAALRRRLKGAALALDAVGVHLRGAPRRRRWRSPTYARPFRHELAKYARTPDTEK